VPETRVPIITLTTDFGAADAYVASMKGAILAVTTQVQIVDITHEVPPHDVAAAAYLLRPATAAFPQRSIHLVVVDPGVGTARRPLVVAAENQYYVGPDNGVFSLLYEADPAARVIHITASHYISESPSPTFHGRDVFAPVAAHVARGLDISNLGDPVEDPVKIDLPRPKVTQEGTIRATVIHVDRFGNVITNVTRAALEALMQKLGKSQVRGGGAQSAVAGMRTTYADGPPGVPFFLYNSSNLLEIAAHQARASDLLKLKAGDGVEVSLA
jgi:S-adenosylmethionine hydrolase